MKDLFGNEFVLPSGSGLPKERLAVHQYKQLISIHGKTDGKKCRDCKHCKQHTGGSKRFYKCHLARVSHSQATDWNSFWGACGKFEKG